MRTTARDKLIAKLVKLATITNTPEEEHDDPADHFGYATERENQEAVDHVRRLARASAWGWCCIKTTAEYAGFKASTYLGGCSYESENDFLKCDDGTQAHEACAALLDDIIDTKHRGEQARDLLRNLHLRFKREDLVKELNFLAAGERVLGEDTE